MPHFLCRFARDFSLSMSPAIKASFFARDHPLIRRSAEIASSILSKYSE